MEKSGIEVLLKLLLRPSIALTIEGMSIALHNTLVLKSFTQHHSTPSARAFCSSLQDNLEKALTGFTASYGSFLLDSKDSRCLMALLAEFGNKSKDILEDVGRIHREILWQIALI